MALFNGLPMARIFGGWADWSLASVRCDFLHGRAAAERWGFLDFWMGWRPMKSAACFFQKWGYGYGSIMINTYKILQVRVFRAMNIQLPAISWKTRGTWFRPSWPYREEMTLTYVRIKEWAPLWFCSSAIWIQRFPVQVVATWPCALRSQGAGDISGVCLRGLRISLLLPIRLDMKGWLSLWFPQKHHCNFNHEPAAVRGCITC